MLKADHVHEGKKKYRNASKQSAHSVVDLHSGTVKCANLQYVQHYCQNCLKVNVEQCFGCCDFFRADCNDECIGNCPKITTADNDARLCPPDRIPISFCNELDATQHHIDTLGNTDVDKIVGVLPL